MTFSRPPDPTSDVPVCSARGCRADAGWVVVWNNPRIHQPERRKTWLACAEHRESLADFLRVRSFLRDVVELDRWRAQEAGDAPGG